MTDFTGARESSANPIPEFEIQGFKYFALSILALMFISVNYNFKPGI